MITMLRESSDHSYHFHLPS